MRERPPTAISKLNRKNFSATKKKTEECGRAEKALYAIFLLPAFNLLPLSLSHHNLQQAHHQKIMHDFTWLNVAKMNVQQSWWCTNITLPALGTAAYFFSITSCALTPASLLPPFSMLLHPLAVLFYTKFDVTYVPWASDVMRSIRS